MNHKEFVQKRYPEAKLFCEPAGNYLVYVDDMALANEHMLPPTYEKEVAWEYARMSLKLTQNFNRTHPYRLSLRDIEKKLDSLNRRRNNGKKHSYEIARKNKK
jgi:hypothetical protein